MAIKPISNRLIQQVARIIDGYAFDAPHRVKRQQVASRKAIDILNLAAAHQVELVDALADSHRRVRALLDVVDTIDVNFHRELDPQMAHWAALLAGYGKGKPDE
jgi:hypothetical protein